MFLLLSFALDTIQTQVLSSNVNLNVHIVAYPILSHFWVVAILDNLLFMVNQILYRNVDIFFRIPCPEKKGKVFLVLKKQNKYINPIQEWLPPLPPFPL